MQQSAIGPSGRSCPSALIGTGSVSPSSGSGGRVAVSPAGDVVPTGNAAGPAAPKAPLYLTPDADGWIEVTTPQTTHVAVAVPGTNLRPMSGEFVPDTCSEAVLTIEPGVPHRRLLAEQAAAQPADRRRR